LRCLPLSLPRAKHYFKTEVPKDLVAVSNQKTLDFYLELVRRGVPVSIHRLFVAQAARFNRQWGQLAWFWRIGLSPRLAPCSPRIALPYQTSLDFVK
jgi:hypothetical protein